MVARELSATCRHLTYAHCVTRATTHAECLWHLEREEHVLVGDTRDSTALQSCADLRIRVCLRVHVRKIVNLTESPSTHLPMYNT